MRLLTFFTKKTRATQTFFTKRTRAIQVPAADQQGDSKGTGTRDVSSELFDEAFTEIIASRTGWIGGFRPFELRKIPSEEVEEVEFNNPPSVYGYTDLAGKLSLHERRPPSEVIALLEHSLRVCRHWVEEITPEQIRFWNNPGSHFQQPEVNWDFQDEYYTPETDGEVPVRLSHCHASAHCPFRPTDRASARWLLEALSCVSKTDRKRCERVLNLMGGGDWKDSLKTTIKFLGIGEETETSGETED